MADLDRYRAELLDDRRGPWWHPWAEYPRRVRAVVRRYHPVLYAASFPLWLGIWLLGAALVGEAVALGVLFVRIWCRYG